MSWMKLKMVQMRDSPRMTEAKMMSAVCERGARPSGVEDPTIGIDESIINNYSINY